jgi:hypothetical protein
MRKHGAKKAAVAVGRKLAVIMHRMLIEEKDFYIWRRKGKSYKGGLGRLGLCPNSRQRTARPLQTDEEIMIAKHALTLFGQLKNYI